MPERAKYMQQKYLVSQSKYLDSPKLIEEGNSVEQNSGPYIHQKDVKNLIFIVNDRLNSSVFAFFYLYRWGTGRVTDYMN